jgi:zinc/manganese transport system permease protein
MAKIIEILGLPFLACAVMGTVLGYLGIHVLKREVIFIDIALAQIAAVGSILAHLVFEAHSSSASAYLCSFCCVLLAAAFYAFVRGRVFQISLEAIIGISYAIAAAAALFLVGILPGGHVHVQEMLSGSLLWTGWSNILWLIVVFSVVFLCFGLFKKPLFAITAQYQHQRIASIRTILWDCFFYILLGAVIILAVKIAGIIVVFSYLIIPATSAFMLTAKMPLQLLIIWSTVILASILGLLFSYYLDFSIGPSIAMFLGCGLIIAPMVKCSSKKLLSKS